MISAVAIFCEDIREEKSGQDTIVGTLPDNLNVSSPPPSPDAVGMLPKFGLYMRINISTADQPKEVQARLIDPKGTVIAKSDWERSVLDKAFADARANAMPITGLVLKLVAAPFPIVAMGKLTAIAVVDSKEYVAGALNIFGLTANVLPPPA
jgi:hypothetical protein